jgi:translocation and assembly module TamB
LQISNQYDDTKGAAVQKITISRKINEKVNASASRMQGKQTSTEVKLQYKINNNVSAIGSYETRSSEEDTSTSGQDQGKSQSIFGLDLEYKRDFK